MEQVIKKLGKKFTSEVHKVFHGDFAMEDIKPFVIAYNAFQEGERCAVDCLFDIRDNQDLLICIKGSMNANEIADVVNNYNSDCQWTPFFLFGENYPTPRQLTFTELESVLESYSEECVEYLLHYPHSVDNDVYQIIIGKIFEK